MTTEEIISEIKANPLCKGITFSGGEPFFQAKEIIPLAEKLKKSEYNIWCYTGYTLEEILTNENKEIKRLLSLCDVLVDGRYEKKSKDLSLAFRGSKNQNILYRGADF